MQLGLLFLFGWCALAGNPEVIARSGKERVHLIELYSSESCSSCPPADRWISSLKSRKGLFRTFVPVVFHVDYWNYLNWKDEFSSDLMTKRQIDLSHKWGKAGVYTPGMVLDGNEWRGWGVGQLPEKSERAEAELELKKVGEEYQVEVLGGNGAKKYVVRMALLGFGITSKVASGENSGKTLNHDFIVLDWQAKPLESSQIVRFMFPALKKNFSSLAAVAWLEEIGDPRPKQVTGGFL